MRTLEPGRTARRWIRSRAARAHRWVSRWRTVRWPLWRTSIRERRRGVRVVHMLHIGKTGGTALKYVLRRNRRTPTCLVLAHRHRVRLADLPPWDDFFFFVRDPTDRFVSGFNSRLREGRPRYFKPWTAQEKRAFSHFGTAEELALALSSEDPGRRRRARQAMRSIRHVRSGLTTWLGSERLLRRRRRHLLMVGRLETIDADFDRLKAALCLPADAALPSADRVAHKDPGAAPRTLSAEARTNIEAWYAEDYRLLEVIAALDPAADRGRHQPSTARPGT